MLTSAKSGLHVVMQQVFFPCLDGKLIKERLAKYCDRNDAFPFLREMSNKGYVKNHSSCILMQYIAAFVTTVK